MKVELAFALVSLGVISLVVALFTAICLLTHTTIGIGYYGLFGFLGAIPFTLGVIILKGKGY